MRPKAFKPWFDAAGNVVQDDTVHLVAGDIEPYRCWSLPGAPIVTSRAAERNLLRAHGKEALSPTEVSQEKALYKPPALPSVREAYAAAYDQARLNARNRKR